MTPEARAKILVARLMFTPPNYFEAVIASSIREAEQAMSKYWDMMVGQERDELRVKVKELEQEIRNLEWRLANERHGS
jgi:hypothetical protein